MSVASTVAPDATALLVPGLAPGAPEGITQIRRATLSDVSSIVELISTNLEVGHLLPRTSEDVTRHAHRFVVVTHDEEVVGCAELAPLSRAVAEVRSLVIDERFRGRGLGSHLVNVLKRWALDDGFSTLCAFTHQASHFVRLGFSIVPHHWLPEKIALDCVGCPKFRACGQYATALALRGGSLRTNASGQRPYLAMPSAPVAAAATPGRVLPLTPVRVQ